MTDWISAAEAADRLGIKQASLYAYVSRGVLSRRREADGRASMFDASEVEALARKGRPRRTGSATELVFESALTEITGNTQRYRGHDATDLALRSSFEDVAETSAEASADCQVRSSKRIMRRALVPM